MHGFAELRHARRRRAASQWTLLPVSQKLRQLVAWAKDTEDDKLKWRYLQYAAVECSELLDLPEEDDSVDLSQFRPGGSSDEEKAAARSDYQDVKICDVNSNSDMSICL